MRKPLVLFVISVTLLGCTTSDIIPINDSQYLLTASGAGFSTAGVIEDVYKEANRYCIKKGATAETVQLTTRAGKAASNPPSAELIFSCKQLEESKQKTEQPQNSTI